MRVLLVNINRERLPDPVAPIGLAYVAGSLVEHGDDVHVADLCFDADPLELLATRVREVRPELVGISMRNVDNTAFPNTTSYLPFTHDVVATIRAGSDAPMVLGGSAFSLVPQHFLRRLDVGLGVVGEGEEVTPKLVEALEAGQDPATVPGVMVWRDGRIRHTPAPPIPAPAPAPMSGWPLFDVPRYWADGGQMPIQTKRGCSFQCTYCTYPLLEGRAVRGREAGEIADEIERWQTDYGIDHFFFVDNVFNNPMAHPSGVLEEIVRRELRIRWTAYLTPRLADDDFCRLMNRSGCQGVELGIDGGSDTTLSSLNKGFTVKEVEQYFALARKHRVRSCATLIFGAPGESQRTIDDTFAMLDAAQPNAVIAVVGVRVYPGSPIWPEAVAAGQVDPNADPIDPAFYLSDELDDEDIRSIYARAEERSNWIMPGHQIRLDHELVSQLRRRNVKGPLWRLLRARQIQPDV